MTDLLIQIFLPISLMIIMLGMGITLVPNDFTRIIKSPKAVLIGLINQLVLLPLIGFGLIILFDINTTMAVGIMILVSCPGGPTSNLITQVCKGNIALSVTLTAISSFMSIVTSQFIIHYALKYFINSTHGIHIELPILETTLRILFITILPITLGMLLRNKYPDLANKMEKPMRKVSTSIFGLIFLGMVSANFNILGDAMKEVGLITLILNITTISVGFFVSKFFNLDTKSSISIALEGGIQNGTLAFVIATTMLQSLEMAIPTAAYSIWMYLTGGLLMWRFNKKNRLITT